MCKRAKLKSRPALNRYDYIIELCEHNDLDKFTLTFTVDDIDSKIIHLEKLNVEFATQSNVYPWGAKNTHFRILTAI